MCLLLPGAIPPSASMLLPRRHGLAMGYACKLPRPWQKGFCPNIHSACVFSMSLGLLCTPVSVSLCGFGKHVCDTMWTLEHICKHHAVHRFCYVAAGNPNCSHCGCCTCCSMWDTQHRLASSCLLHACASRAQGLHHATPACVVAAAASAASVVAGCCCCCYCLWDTHHNSAGNTLCGCAMESWHCACVCGCMCACMCACVHECLHV